MEQVWCRRLMCVLFLSLCFMGDSAIGQVSRQDFSGTSSVQSTKGLQPRRPLRAGPAIPEAAAAVLRTYSELAGVIFAGHVVEVQRHDAVGYVDVVFAIDRPVRGCEGLKRYVLREWAGLWGVDPPRYGVGQRLLMILAPRGPAGMSAPLGGMAGRIPMLGMRPPPLAHATGVAPADTSQGAEAEDAVDLRWIEAQALRSTASGSIARAQTMQADDWVGPAAPMFSPRAGAEEPSLTAVLAVINGR